MKFFSGFCLENESELFKSFINQSDFCVAGFSLGAINAVEYVARFEGRVDSLQLFSPAFFQDRDEKFKRVQLLHFRKDESSYLKQFFKNIASPSTLNMSRYHKKGSIKDLKLLLEYRYERELLQKIVNQGTDIEVYLGESDKIIDHKKAEDFFKLFATIYILKNRGHILHG